MSLRRTGGVVQPVAASRLDAVLAAGQREVEATGGIFKASPLNAFRSAVTEHDDRKAKAKLSKAAGALKPDQSKALADEYAKAEAKAWGDVAKVATYADYHKERNANTKALEALLKAQAGGTLRMQSGMVHQQPCRLARQVEQGSTRPIHLNLN